MPTGQTDGRSSDCYNTLFAMDGASVIIREFLSTLQTSDNRRRVYNAVQRALSGKSTEGHSADLVFVLAFGDVLVADLDLRCEK